MKETVRIRGIYSGLLVKEDYKKVGFIVIEVRSVFKTKVLPHMMKSCSQIDKIKGNMAVVLGRHRVHGLKHLVHETPCSRKLVFPNH
jgi:hypothetical protein